MAMAVSLRTQGMNEGFHKLVSLVRIVSIIARLNYHAILAPFLKYAIDVGHAVDDRMPILELEVLFLIPIGIVKPVLPSHNEHD